jgi:hypothetical protein
MMPMISGAPRFMTGPRRSAADGGRTGVGRVYVDGNDASARP